MILNPKTNEYVNTLADKELPKYDNALCIQMADESGVITDIPVWRFIERYLKIKDKSGKVVPFELNLAQVELYKELCEQRLHGKPMRVNILKARQLGFSTFIAAIIFVLTILVPNQTACIVADLAEHATNLFNKYIFYYHCLPDYFKVRLPLRKSNAKELEVDYGKGQSSKIRVLVQGVNAGRSDTCQYLHLSEVAFWKDIEDTTTSIVQTVDNANPNSLIAYETTANGVNYYKKIWDDDVATKGVGYKALFFAWHLDPKHKMKYDGFRLFDWEVKLMNQFHLSLEQIAWYRAQYNEMRGNLAMLRQEHPSNAVEAFITSGNNKFNLELIQMRKAELIDKAPLLCGLFSYKKEVSLDGERVDVSDVKFVESEVGEIEIFEKPNKLHPYIVCNDPAMGGEDYFATQVLDNYTGKQVAVYHKNKCDADDAAYQMYCLAMYYSCPEIKNYALVTGETNTTSYLLKIVHKCGYPLIYQDSDVENLGVRFQDKLGFKTKQNNRTYMIDLFALSFRDNPRMINDYKTLCEMENFQVVRSDTGKEKLEAISGEHDDLVMAMCGAFLCRNQQRAVPYEEEKLKEVRGYNFFDDMEKYTEPEQVKGDFQWD